MEKITPKEKDGQLVVLAEIIKSGHDIWVRVDNFSYSAPEGLLKEFRKMVKVRLDALNENWDVLNSLQEEIGK